jgi:predicted nucleic acid-binding Zn ribbon protein
MPGAQLVQHKHCATCGKVILPSEVTCEGECAQQWEKVKRHRKWFWRGWFVATALIILLVVTFGPR